jgi:hypothetical protein
MDDWTDCVVFSLGGEERGFEGSLEDIEEEVDEEGEEEEERISDFRAESFSDSAACSFESSAATRCAMCRSRVLARVEFVYCRGRGSAAG